MEKKNSMMNNGAQEEIDREVFEKFFTESYCPIEYAVVKEEFEQIAAIGNEIFTEGYQAKNLNRENFYLYLTSDSYCNFEAAVQEAMDTINPEILDAVMDIVELQGDGEEVTEKYWEMQRVLLIEFLQQLFDETISHWK